MNTGNLTKNIEWNRRDNSNTCRRSSLLSCSAISSSSFRCFTVAALCCTWKREYLTMAITYCTNIMASSLERFAAATVMPPSLPAVWLRRCCALLLRSVSDNAPSFVAYILWTMRPLERRFLMNIHRTVCEHALRPNEHGFMIKLPTRGFKVLKYETFDSFGVVVVSEKARTIKRNRKTHTPPRYSQWGTKKLFPQQTCLCNHFTIKH